MDKKLSVPTPFYRLSPRIVNTLFILLMQAFFANHPEYPYIPNDSRTMMDIAADFDEEDYIQKALPLLIVMNGPSRIEASGTGTGVAFLNTRKQWKDGAIIDKPYLVDTIHQYLVTSSVVIRITANSKDDVDELAFEVGMFLSTVKFDVGNVLNLQMLGSVNVNPGEQSDQVGWNGKYVATVSMDYAYAVGRRYLPVDMGPVLKEVDTIIKAKGVSKEPLTIYSEILASDESLDKTSNS